jgi:hypothetical protein
VIATADDVLDGFRALWAAAGLPVAVPGGLYDARGLPAGTPLPFALARVMPGDVTRWSSETDYLRSWQVTVWVHAVNGTHDRRGIDRGVESVRALRTLWPAGSGRLTILRQLPQPRDPSPVQATLARDVAVAASAWELTVHQRPAAVGVL